MPEPAAGPRRRERAPRGRNITAGSQATRERLILTAERLFAERGFQVPLRDILAAAGHRNDNGIAYHFGGRDELIAAVALHRVEQVDALRHRMTDEILASTRPRESGRVRRLLEACIVPLAAQRDGHFLGFAARLQSDFGQWDRFRVAPGAWDGWSRVVAILEDELPDLHAAQVRQRMQLVATLVVPALATRVMLEHDGIKQTEPFEPWLRRLVDAAEAMVVAKPRPSEE